MRTAWSCEIVKKGGKAIAILGRMWRRGPTSSGFSPKRKQNLGTPSILVNNAGVFTFAPIEAVTEEDIERQFRHQCARHAARKQGSSGLLPSTVSGGAIINMSTIASVNPVPNSLVYSASKAAVDTITRALGARTRSEKVLASTRSRRERRRRRARKRWDWTMEAAKAMGVATPMGRMGQPDDIARVALFLATDESSWLTGERISASGGQR